MLFLRFNPFLIFVLYLEFVYRIKQLILLS